MNQNKPREMKLKATTINYYLITTCMIVIIFPLICISVENVAERIPLNWILIGKWFIFWAIGIRLFTAGIKQASDPAFTAIKIFKLHSKESYVIIRELGFANICLGITSILSLINNQWRPIGAITGVVFFGFAGLQHISKKHGQLYPH